MILARKGNVHSVCYAGPSGPAAWCAELRARSQEKRRAQNASWPSEVPAGPAKRQPVRRSASRPRESRASGLEESRARGANQSSKAPAAPARCEAVRRSAPGRPRSRPGAVCCISA